MFKIVTGTDWQPSSDIQTLKRRAQLLSDVRRFFAERGVLEVETPILSQSAPTAIYLDSFSTDYQPTGLTPKSYFLQTSPEFAMKRLLAAGCGDIYQIARVFRHGELGRLHNPEFTMLEWYRPTLTYKALMQEVDTLLQDIAGFLPAIYERYHSLFLHYLNLNLEQTDTDSLRQTALDRVSALPDDWQCDRDGWLDILMSEVIEPELAKRQQPVIVYAVPASQAQLAKLYENDLSMTVAARFEVYAGGLELANGYDECLDAAELRARFNRDNEQRRAAGKSQMPMDDRLLAGIHAGMPACTGVALGLDRLLLLITGKNNLADVISFAFERS